jgi:hypothetical protein
MNWVIGDEFERQSGLKDLYFLQESSLLPSAHSPQPTIQLKTTKTERSKSSGFWHRPEGVRRERYFLGTRYQLFSD